MRNSVRFSILGAAIALATSQALAADVVREGAGERRDTLDEMELTPFQASNWSELSSWTNGDPVTADATSGKVVLIATWSSWYKPSWRAITLGESLMKKYGDKGLLVVGVHNQRGWSRGPDVVEQRGVSFPVAHDAEGAFAEALLVDQDPDFYVIDRAGRLRYADIALQSVEEAVEELVGESRQEAGDLPSLLKQREAQEWANQERTRGINPALSTLADIPRDLSFDEPSDATWELARETFPRMSKEFLNDVGLGTRGSRNDDEESELLALDFSIPGADAQWASAPPESTRGRLIVAYAFHPDVHDSWQVVDQMDALQRKYGRDIVVVGAMVPFDNLLDRRRGRNDDEGETAAERQLKFLRFARSRNFKHHLVLDESAVVLNALSSNRRRGDLLIPNAFIVTSDGKARFYGPPWTSDFQGALDSLLRRDPGVQARRKAEQAYIDGRK